MMKIIKRINFCLLVVCIISGMSSCISYKKIPYFQDLDSNQVELPTTAYSTPVIQKNDMLGVYISALSESTSALFGVPASEADNSISTTAGGFLVDENGEIAVKTLGKIKAQGLTTLQLQKIITEKVATLVNNPTVVVRIQNFKISVEGEVNRPGVFNIPNGKINLLEALSMAGDLKISGKRENVLIMRQYGPTEMKIAHVNLTSKNALKSPYFFLQNNDIIYVEPSVQSLERDNNFYRNVSLFASIVSIISVIFIRFIK